jgi:hypothetical protein
MMQKITYSVKDLIFVNRCAAVDVPEFYGTVLGSVFWRNNNCDGKFL